jgi:hypothetical protein
MFKMGFPYAFWVFKTQVMAKRKARSQSANLIFDQQKLGIALIYLCAWGVTHIIGKLSMKLATLLQNSPQLEVCTQNYEPPKLRECQFQEFQDSNLGVPRKNDIWVRTSWLSIENIIRGKVVASPKSGPW